MGRTAAPVTPGTTPTTAADADAGRMDAVYAQTGTIATHVADSAAGAAAGEQLTNEQLQALVLAQAKQMDEMRAMMGQMVRQQQAAVPSPVKLPTMAEVLKDGKPTSPVLTEEGWYVPAVLPSQRSAG